MQQLVYSLDPDRLDPAIIAEAGRRLRAGGIIAHPSDTVFGLAAAARHEGALQRLRFVKGTDDDRPFIVLLDDSTRIDSLVHFLRGYAVDLIARHWPGPLTLIFDARPGAPCRAADGSIAVRCPDHALTRALVSECEGLMASTSANHTGQPTVRSAREAVEMFGADEDGISLAIDLTPTASAGLEPPRASTIVDCRGESPRVVRQGSVVIEPE